MTFQDSDTAVATPSGQPALVEMWRSAINKAAQHRSLQGPVVPPPTAALIINFDGAGLPLTVGMGGIPQMPQGAFEIIGVHMAAGVYSVISGGIDPVPVTAQVTLRQATAGAWAGGSVPLWGPSGPPTMAGVAEFEEDLTDWTILQLQPGDMIPYCLTSFDGSATVLTVTITLRKISSPGLDTTGMVDADGNPIADADARDLVNRGV